MIMKVDELFSQSTVFRELRVNREGMRGIPGIDLFIVKGSSILNGNPHSKPSCVMHVSEMITVV